ncbi:Na/Pi symporter [Evansella cellulosilytica]|uniref:Na/Pi-cotransporter II-related protein n=1 Tax=Evansella cellulosilytica (strain ATCC 21833 / DSM 2522 / FERM P-1141 / JCM 9156 / N-4) TaxID=649639 RepID=E6TW34_EVAC2|nr:Na/Pi symporter [Evansella cellulosilytica]ADU29857.1 Na/Pi-cotransporter II-related protein [Evansella cellulosilytica DSM 2522]
MNQIFSLFAIYISLFLFGMTVMRHGLMQLQQNKMKTWIYTFVDHPAKGFLVGILVTAILQSSSAVMIITVGLVAAKYIPFKHSIGIILGTNIGTVVTLEVLAIDLSWLIFPLLIIGIFFLLTKNYIVFSIGCFLFGFSSIIVAMDGFQSLSYPISSITSIYNWFLITNEYTALALSIGISLTAIIQSSSAVIAMSMSFMNENILHLPTGIIIMLGANLGTCTTAWLASLGGSKESKLTAYAHIWINFIGLVIFLPFVPIFSQFIEQLSSVPSQQLAHATLIYNVVCSILILPFTNQFSQLIQRIHRTPLK